jgi:hypothetical protein
MARNKRETPKRRTDLLNTEQRTGSSAITLHWDMLGLMVAI